MIQGAKVRGQRVEEGRRRKGGEEREEKRGGEGEETVTGNKNSDGNCQLDTIMEMSPGEGTGGGKCPLDQI